MLWESSAIQMKIIELSETDSTNEYCKRLDAVCDTLVTADRQSAGKGTKGRSFVSSEGGVYISLMRFYNDFPASAAFKSRFSIFSQGVSRSLKLITAKS